MCSSDLLVKSLGGGCEVCSTTVSSVYGVNVEDARDGVGDGGVCEASAKAWLGEEDEDVGPDRLLATAWLGVARFTRATGHRSMRSWWWWRKTEKMRGRKGKEVLWPRRARSEPSHHRVPDVAPLDGAPYGRTKNRCEDGGLMLGWARWIRWRGDGPERGMERWAAARFLIPKKNIGE